MRAPTSMRLSEAAAEWLKRAEAGSIRNRSGDEFKPSALRSHETCLRLRVLPRFGAVRLSELARADVQRFIGDMLANGLEASTVRNTINSLRAIYRDADVLADGTVAMNPCLGLRLPAVHGKRERIASPAEAAALILALPAGDRALWGAAFYAGLRRGELRALRWSDVDLRAGIIRVERSWDTKSGPVEPKSRAGRRAVPIATALRVLLVEHKLQSTAELVFAGRADRPFNPATIVKRARQVWERAELEPIGLHECRHTFASLMIAAGVNAKALSTYLGHANISTTFDRYGHLMPGNESEAAELLDQYLKRQA